MVEFFTPDGPGNLLAELCRLVAQRSPADVRLAADFAARGAEAQKRFDAAREELSQRRQRELAAAKAEHAAARRAAAEKLDAEYGNEEKLHSAAKSDAISRFESGQQAAQQQRQEIEWEATTIADAALGGAGLNLADLLAQLDGRWRELHEIARHSHELLQQRGQWREFPQPPVAGVLLERHPAQRFTHALELAKEQFQTLSSQKTPRLFTGLWSMLALFAGLWLAFFAGLWAATIGPQFWALKSGRYVLGWDDAICLFASGGAAFVVFLITIVYLRVASRRQTTQAYLPLRRTFLEAGLDRPAVLETAKAECQRLCAAVKARYDGEMKRAEERFVAVMAELSERRQQEVQQADELHRPRLAAMIARRDSAQTEAEAAYSRRTSNLERQFDEEAQTLRRRFDETVAENQRQYERQWAELTDRWTSGLARLRASIEDIRKRSAGLFPAWDADAWRDWAPPTEIPAAIRFGEGEASLARIEGGLPADPRLKPSQTDFSLPLLLPFPRHSLLLLKAAREGRAKAVAAIQAIMLRMLTAMPPGKVRFTILDPVGLGENFSAFMHLADYDDQLVASRIWTDSGHIEQRLADLTDHMENVIQVYLRNEFPSIEEYNRFAGEMAEPYRILVVADFPANFSEEAAHRLKSIVASGARCGVFVLASVDTTLPPPRQFHFADIEADAMVLNWSEGRFTWRHPDYGVVPTAIDAPPPPDRFTDIVRGVGRQVKDASRVEVPFACVAPEPSAWWTADSRSGVNVPLGRAGAMKLQHLDLGKGTSQHVLMSGKTGSGKSTLLHVLITNIALRYSPDEVELYLVDFKKGVEFKAYARFALPHARVVAVESEREFGLSVLQHLDGELRRRGDMFRGLGVQDVKGFRNSQPDAKLPRILLIVDEFQELFVDDDRLAQEGALLLDRLVRQGRAFGIHVLLGSQTLGGAYSLARSTIGQMAVRIALQCSEADAHLILSEENTAARLLTRPGEAIYNDANGVYEGNHPFQVVWLPDDERDRCLQQIAAYASRQGYVAPRTIVFEGNVLSDPSENQQLHDLLAAANWPEAGPGRAWFGSAVAIADPTSAVFQRQAGNNLLLAGHREEAALGVMAASLLSLAAQHPPAGAGEGAQASGAARFYILDGTRPDAPEVGFWNRLLPALPHAVALGAVRQSGEILAEIAAELARRQDEGGDKAPPIYLLIYNLGRFRDIRREDDYGFGGDDDGKAASPAKLFATILRDGPAVGVHTLAWCDSYGTLNRMLDRQGLRDFELRVLFQMNGTDSSNLMETPDASRLGVHRAIFYDEAQGKAEKFRPYGLPSGEWLSWIGQRLRERSRSPLPSGEG